MELSDLKYLANFEPDRNYAVSLYLNINAMDRRHSDIKAVLNQLIEEEGRDTDISHHRRKHFKTDIERIEAFFSAELFKQEKNRAIAIFSKSTSNVFEVFYFSQPIQDRLVYSKNFFIRPLLGYIDQYPKFLALLVDQQRGRFLEVEQGKITDYDNSREEVPNKVREGGWHGYEEHHIERHVDDHIHQHYRKVANQAFWMLQEHDFKWLILLGTAENLTNFKKTIHTYLKQKLVAEIPSDLAQHPNDEILKRVYIFLNEKLVTEHHDLEHKLSEKNTNQAVVGLEKVNNELEKKSVYKLLLSNDFRPVYVSTSLNLDFKTNDMVVKALNQDSEIHFISNEYLSKNGGIGAILRYPITKSA